MFSKLQTSKLIKSFKSILFLNQRSLSIFTISRLNRYVIKMCNAWLWCRWSEAEVECGHGAVPASRGRDRGGGHGVPGARAQSRPDTRPGHCPPALAPGVNTVDIKYHETGLKDPKMWLNKYTRYLSFLRETFIKFVRTMVS